MPSPINLASASIAGTTSSARTAYPGVPTKNAVFIYNSGAVPVFVKSGNSSVVATASDSFVGAGQSRLFMKDPLDTHLAAITASSTATVYFSEAERD